MKVAGGASTMSRQPGRRPMLPGLSESSGGLDCKLLHLGEDRLTRVIDWPMGQHGPIFGYAYDELALAIKDGIASLSFDCTSYAPEVEAQVAALIGEIFLDVERVRFGKNGSDVASAAVRLARAVTGRDRIAVQGYHGFGAEFAHSPQNRGVPQCLQDLATWFEWGDSRAMWLAARHSACVIVEVPPVDDKDKAAQFLQNCRWACDQYGTIFILDEIVTGFRLALGGAAEYYGVRPDLYCWGKAISNGHAVSCIGGSAKLMEEFQNGVFFSATFFDDPLGLTAAYSTLKRLQRERDVVYPHLYGMGAILKSGFNALAESYHVKGRCVGQEPRTVFEFEDEDYRKDFNLECLKRGVLFDRPNFTSMAHTRQIVCESLDAVENAFKVLQ